MSLSINTTYVGMSTIRNLALIKRNLSRTMQRLSSGEKINHASDEPAELVISEKMRAQIGELTQTLKNLELAINKNNAADGALGELFSKAAKMREITVAAANGGELSREAQQVFQDEIDRVVESYNDQVANVSFGNVKLLDGTDGSVVMVNSVNAIDLTDPEKSDEAIAAVDEILKEIDLAETKVGSQTENALASTTRRLAVSAQNLEAAESVIRDTSYAQEQSNYLREMIQLKTGVAALAQGNLLSESVFKLMQA